jgi:hypothetical protein
MEVVIASEWRVYDTLEVCAMYEGLKRFIGTDTNRSHRTAMGLIGMVALVTIQFGGCPFPQDLFPSTENGDMPPVFNNTTDMTNTGAVHLGATACMSCHPTVRTWEPAESVSCSQCHSMEIEPPEEVTPAFSRRVHTGCEVCHGPGSNHIPDPGARDLFVDSSGAATCNVCHVRETESDSVQASGGFILHHQQQTEILASGGHAEFSCVVCHDPHGSPTFDPDNAIRNDCTACHDQQNMAIHDGKTFLLGETSETLSCESCHMPYATRAGAAAGPDAVGEFGRKGDNRTHIFRIRPDASDFNAMFSEDGQTVAVDEENRASVTVDFVCLRCHNGLGNAFELTLEAAASIADGMHEIQGSQ